MQPETYADNLQINFVSKSLLKMSVFRKGCKISVHMRVYALPINFNAQNSGQKRVILKGKKHKNKKYLKSYVPFNFEFFF